MLALAYEGSQITEAETKQPDEHEPEQAGKLASLGDINFQSRCPKRRAMRKKIAE